MGVRARVTVQLVQPLEERRLLSIVPIAVGQTDAGNPNRLDAFLATRSPVRLTLPGGIDIPAPADGGAAAQAASVIANAPIGVARGIYPGRVVWMHDAAATTWNGNKTNGTYWWDQNGADQTRVDAMVSQSLQSLTARGNDAAAWEALFRSYNSSHGKGNLGYRAGQKIAIKINQNTADTYALNGHPLDQNSINSSPQVIKSLLRQLVNEAGVPQEMITIYDASRCIADAVYLPNHAEFPNVHFADGYGGQGRELIAWSAGDEIAYANEHALGRQIPLPVMDASYLINLATMKDHGDGPTLCAKNMYGSIGHNNTAIAGTGAQGDHAAIYHSGGMGSYSTLVDLMGQPNLGEKTVLFMIDALYGAPGVAADPVKWNSAPFNGWWPSSVFMSQDGVAIDSVGFDFMNAEWGMAENSENYLHEAALADHPPSGTNYIPDGVNRLISQGTQEHWNNATAKNYSRNLSPTGTGIELWRIEVKLSGTVIGTPGSYNNSGSTREKAFDGDLVTYFDAPTANDAWTGQDLGRALPISAARYYPRAALASRMVGGKFQGSNDLSLWTNLGTIATTPSYAWNTLTFANAAPFRYVRFLSPNNGWCNVAELEFYGPPGLDRVLPAVRQSHFVYDSSPIQLMFDFSEDVSASFVAGDLLLQNLTTGTSIPADALDVRYDSSTDTAIFTLPGLGSGPWTDGNYRATLMAGSLTDAAANPIDTSIYDFYFLGADANHDRKVDLRDLVALAINWMGTGRSFSQGDFNYDGLVNSADLGILARRWQQTLAPAPPPAQYIPVSARPPARTPTRVITLLEPQPAPS